MKDDHGRARLADTMEIAAREFKSRCLTLMDEVSTRRTSVIITRRGKPVAMLVPVEAARGKLFGCMKGTGQAAGDIVTPVGKRWDAES